MRLSSVLAGATLLVPAIALASPVRESGTAGMYEFVATAPDANDLVFARQVLPPSSTPTASAVALSRVIYLNYNGVTLSPGTNDSRTNKSTIATQQTAIAAWNASATVKSATTACMKEIFGPFNVTITDTDPGNVNHIEAVFGGSPGQLGLPSNVAGVSPFTTDCSIIENSIVFTFTNVIPADARTACEIMAQEVAHSYGLDHELLASDPMTYLQYNGNRSFQNMTVSCGESTARPCGINGNTCRANQNSVTLLAERVGTKGTPGDTTAPDVNITFPPNNSTVPPGFTVKATATDNIAVTMASIYIDGNPAGSITAGPYEFMTAATLPDGAHVIKVEATDGTNVQSSTINVTVKKGAPPPTGGGNNTGGGGDDGSDISGGCAAGGNGAGLFLGLALLGLAIRRRN
jgi:uncharacterized protein (TIGR03382 family)